MTESTVAWRDAATGGVRIDGRWRAGGDPSDLMFVDIPLRALRADILLAARQVGDVTRVATLSDVTFRASTATIRALYAQSTLRPTDAPTDRELREMPHMLLGSPAKIDDNLDYGEFRASILLHKIDRVPVDSAALVASLDPDAP